MRGEPSRQPPRPPQPHAALTHPVWLLALATLILNDHVLKGAGVLPGWLTGKLSDVAGLMVAPALLAVALRLRGRWGLLLAHGAVGAVFAAINLWPAASRGLEALTALGPLPWHIVTDPTDLLALPALGASWALLARSGRSAGVSLAGARRWAARAAFGAGALACMATSPPEPDPGPDPYYPDGNYYSDLYANLAIANATDGDVVVRVRALRDSVTIDCGAVSEDPQAMLSRALFDEPVAWSIPPDGAISLTDGEVWGGAAYGECPAFLVDGPGLAEKLVFFLASAYPAKYLPSSASGADNERTIKLVKGSESTYVYSSHPALGPPPALFDPSPTAECAAAVEAGAVAWSKPLPLGDLVVHGLTASPDGCTRLDLALAGGGAPAPWYLCHPGVELPFAVGDAVHVRAVSGGTTSGAAVDAVQIVSSVWTVTVGRGTGLPAAAGVAVGVSYGSLCGDVHTDCGALLRPLDVHLQGYGDTAGEGGEALEPPGPAPRSFALVDGTLVTVLRAVMAVVVDSECGDVNKVASPWVESVIVGATEADAGGTDAGESDAGSHDAGESDAGGTDAGESDAGSHDAGEADAGSHDARESDAGEADGGSWDAGGADAGEQDGAADAGSGDDTGDDAAVGGDTTEVDDGTGDAAP